jgi:hypothetical protein
MQTNPTTAATEIASASLTRTCGWIRVVLMRTPSSAALIGARKASDSNALLEQSLYSGTSSKRIPRPALKLLRACSMRSRKRGSFSSL